MATTMKASHAMSAKMAECYIEYGGNRYNMMNAINLEAKAEIKKGDVPILGKAATGKKANGWEGSGSATFHLNDTFFRYLMRDYKKTGNFPTFDMQVVNVDPSEVKGSQIIKLKNCCLDSAVLAKFDASSDDVLEEDIDFTFDDFELAQAFTRSAGFAMGAIEK